MTVFSGPNTTTFKNDWAEVLILGCRRELYGRWGCGGRDVKQRYCTRWNRQAHAGLVKTKGSESDLSWHLATSSAGRRWPCEEGLVMNPSWQWLGPISILWGTTGSYRRGLGTTTVREPNCAFKNLRLISRLCRSPSPTVDLIGWSWTKALKDACQVFFRKVLPFPKQHVVRNGTPSQSHNMDTLERISVTLSNVIIIPDCRQTPIIPCRKNRKETCVFSAFVSIKIIAGL